MLHAGDPDDAPVEVSLIVGLRHPPPNPVGGLLAGLGRPRLHCLPADDDAAGRERRLDHAPLSGDWKYSDAAWLMTYPGNRCPTQGDLADERLASAVCPAGSGREARLSLAVPLSWQTDRQWRASALRQALVYTATANCALSIWSNGSTSTSDA
jgi:hypothetical protein